MSPQPQRRVMKTVIHFTWVCWFFLGAAAIAESRGEVREGDLQTVTLQDYSTILHEGAMTTISVGGGWRFVDKIWVRGQAYGANGRIEVWADGDHVCDMEFPVTDPTLTCTIRATIRSIELRAVRGHRVNIMNVVSHQSRAEVDARGVREAPEEYGLPRDFRWEFDKFRFPREGGVAVYLAQEANYVVDRLFRMVDTVEDYTPYLMPIKDVAGTAEAIARSATDLSFKTLFAMLRLKKQIEYAKPLMKKLLKRPDVYPLAVRLLGVMEAIDDRLKIREVEDWLKKHPEGVKELEPQAETLPAPQKDK